MNPDEILANTSNTLPDAIPPRSSHKVLILCASLVVVLIAAICAYFFFSQKQSVQTLESKDVFFSLPAVNAYLQPNFGFSFKSNSSDDASIALICNNKAPKNPTETTLGQYTYCQNNGSPLKINLSWKKANMKVSDYFKLIANTVMKDKKKASGNFVCVQDNNYPGKLEILSDCKITTSDGSLYYFSAVFFYPSPHPEISQVMYVYDGNNAPNESAVKEMIRNLTKELVFTGITSTTSTSATSTNSVSFLWGLLGTRIARADDSGGGDGGGDGTGGSGGNSSGGCDSSGTDCSGADASSVSSDSTSSPGTDSGPGAPDGAPGDPPYIGSCVPGYTVVNGICSPVSPPHVDSTYDCSAQQVTANWDTSAACPASYPDINFDVGTTKNSWDILKHDYAPCTGSYTFNASQNTTYWYQTYYWSHYIGNTGTNSDVWSFTTPDCSTPPVTPTSSALCVPPWPATSVWNVSANGGVGTMTLNTDGTGTMHLNGEPSGSLANVVLSGSSVSFYRYDGNEQFTGTIGADGLSIAGTFTYQSGTYNWSATENLGGQSAPVCPTVSTAPTVPILSALWKNSAYIGPNAPAYDASGYQVEAQATSPSGSNLSYYFEWSSDTAAAEWSDWVGSGGWGSVTHYASYTPATYYVRAWAYDQNGNWSASPTAWMPITLTSSGLSVSCVGTPGNPYIGQPVTWSSSVSGGSGTYTYSWSGTDNFYDTNPTVEKSYTTPGTKQASLSVTDTASNQTASADCTAGANQPNGPTNGGTGGGNGGNNTGINVGSCAASISASPDTVMQGQNVTISWSVTGGPLCASSCSGNGFDTGGATSGSAASSVPPSPPSTSYSLTCSSGTYGPPPPADAVVSVVIPTVAITANGQSGTTRVNQATPNNTVIAWSSTNSTSCTVTKNGSAWETGTSSSGVTDTVTSQTTYAIDCVNGHGAHATGSVLVNTLAKFQEF
jgi:hypothetical protein